MELMNFKSQRANTYPLTREQIRGKVKFAQHNSHIYWYDFSQLHSSYTIAELLHSK